MNCLVQYRMASLAMLFFISPAIALDLRTRDGVEVPVAVHAAPGNTVLLWLPSGSDAVAAEEVQAEKIRALGIEVWRADLLSARFLPTLESSLEQVPLADIVSLIEAAQQKEKRVVLLAAGRGGLLALRGAHAWQAAHPQAKTLDGIILLHPNLYLGAPDAGREAEFHPQVARVHFPVHVVQPQKSPWHFRLAALQSTLDRGGARVSVQVLPGVRDRYYFRADATAAEDMQAANLPQLIQAGIARLRQAGTARNADKPPSVPPTSKHAVRRGLQAYRGNPLPAALQLRDVDGRLVNLADLRNRVVLINFWASWCPPCVQEMPSMQRLKEKLAGQPFTILAVNMAESEAEARAFIKKTHVDFPVLMDRDGAVLKQWKVFVFPTSFVIDTTGRIRLGAIGEVEWDSPEIVEIFKQLLPVPP